MALNLERRCRDCETRFDLSASEIAFFESRGLGVPKRCPSCRAERAEHRQIGVTGVVERFDPRWRRGLGVIVADSGERILVAWHAVADPPYGPLLPGQRVQFEIEPGRPLRRASDVRVIAEPDYDRFFRDNSPRGGNGLADQSTVSTTYGGVVDSQQQKRTRK